MAAISRDFVTKNGIIIEGNSAVTSSTNQIGTLQAAGGAAIAKNLIVGTTATIFGDATVNSSLTVNGQTNLGGPLIPLSSGVTLGSLATPFKDLYLTGDSLYVGRVVLSSTGTVATLNSTLGSVRLVVGSSRLIDTTNSTSTTTGALVVNGGIGVARDVYVGNNLNVINSSTLHGSANLLSTLTVQGQSTFADTTLATSAGAGSVKLAGGIRVGSNAVILSTASNTSTLESNSLYVAGGVGIDSGLAVSGTSVFKGDVYFQGATTYVYSTNTIYTDNILDLHVPATGIDGTWIADDGKDIGFRFNYYSGSDKNALLLLSNNSKKLEFFSDSNVYGEFKTGGVQLVNPTSNNGSTNTGALTVVGGVGIGQNLRVGGTITATNIAISGIVNAQGLVYQDAAGQLISQPHIVYNTSTQVLVGTITRANNLTGGTIGSIPIQSNNGITTFITPGELGQVLIWDSLTSTAAWGYVSGTSAALASTATNLSAGAAGNVVYQSAVGITAYLANGSTGSILTFNTGTLAPQWSEPSTLSVGFATSASYATSSTYAINAELATTATYALLAETSTRALLADTATYALLAETSTYALLANTATYALLAETSTRALLADTATYALLAETSTYALLAETSTRALLADTATYALLAETSTYALLANTATYALLAETSTYALLAETSTYALFAGTATYALLAETSTRALLADTATYALLAETSTYALFAGTATHALSADFATSATYAFTATYAEIGGQSALAQNLSGGTTGQIPYQFNTDVTNFFGPGNAGDILVSAGTTSTGPIFTNTSSIHVGYVDNVVGGSAGSIVYQTGTDATGMLSISSTAGSILVSNGTIPQYISQIQAIPNGVANYSTASGQSLVITEGGLGVVGDSYFSNSVNIANALYIGGDLYVDGTQFIVNSQSIATGDKTITLNTGAGTAILAADSGLQVGSVTAPYANFLFNGIDSWVTGGTDGTGLKVTSTAPTYSGNSGALQVTGGVGIGGALFVSGNVTATTFFGNLTGIATTATYALLAETSTRALLADTATYALLANTATYSLDAGTSSYALFAGTATYALLAETSTYALLANTATYALLAETATRALLADTATYALLANTATYALLAETATRALLADTATYALLAETSTYALLAETSTRALLADTATYAILANFATSATYAFTATYAEIGGNSAFASTASWASTASNIDGGALGSLPYQSAAGITTFLGIGTSTYLLTSDGSAPIWTSLGELSSGNTAFADNVKDGTAGQLVYQISTSTTGFAGPGNVGEILVSNGTSGPLYTNTSSIYVGRAVLADTATLALLANTSTYALLANTATYALLAETSTRALLADTATYALLAETSTRALLADTATYALLAETSTYALLADTATYALLAETSTRALLADTATLALLANTATIALDAITATYTINILGGVAGSIPYQTQTNQTDFLAPGTTSSLLVQGPNFPQWISTIQAQIGTGSFSTSSNQSLRVTSGGLGVTGDSYFADRVGVGGSINVANTSYINNSRILIASDLENDTFFTSTTDSFSTITGALVVTGGVGIGKTLNVGSSATILSTLASTATVQDNALYVAGGVGIAKSLYVTGPAIFNDNVIFAGTATYIYSTNTVYTDNFIDLHVPAGSIGINHDWGVDDGQDIGFVLHYYKGSTDKNAFLGLANDTGYLEWYNDGTEVGNVFTGTSYGTFKTGSILLVDTTASISTSTGALIVRGGVGIGGALYVRQTSYVAGSEIVTTSTINLYANQTSIFAGTDTAVSSNTGNITVWNTSTLQTVTGRGASTNVALSFTNVTSATSTTTGALTVTGGVGIQGSLYAGTIYSNGYQVLTTAGGSSFVSSVSAGTDISVSTTTGAVIVSNTSTLQTVTSRGATTNVAVSITNSTASASTTTGALQVAGGVGVGGSVYVGNRVGFVNASNVSRVYQVYNAATDSLDTVFG
jgi:hypothetical protein